MYYKNHSCNIFNVKNIHYFQKKIPRKKSVMIRFSCCCHQTLMVRGFQEYFFPPENHIHVISGICFLPGASHQQEMYRNWFFILEYTISGVFYSHNNIIRYGKSWLLKILVTVINGHL